MTRGTRGAAMRWRKEQQEKKKRSVTDTTKQDEISKMSSGTETSGDGGGNSSSASMEDQQQQQQHTQYQKQYSNNSRHNQQLTMVQQQQRASSRIRGRNRMQHATANDQYSTHSESSVEQQQQQLQHQQKQLSSNTVSSYRQQQQRHHNLKSQCVGVARAAVQQQQQQQITQPLVNNSHYPHPNQQQLQQHTNINNMMLSGELEYHHIPDKEGYEYEYDDFGKGGASVQALSRNDTAHTTSAYSHQGGVEEQLEHHQSHIGGGSGDGASTICDTTVGEDSIMGKDCDDLSNAMSSRNSNTNNENNLNDDASRIYRTREQQRRETERRRHEYNARRRRGTVAITPALPINSNDADSSQEPPPLRTKMQMQQLQQQHQQQDTVSGGAFSDLRNVPPPAIETPTASALRAKRRDAAQRRRAARNSSASHRHDNMGRHSKQLKRSNNTNSNNTSATQNNNHDAGSSVVTNSTTAMDEATTTTEFSFEDNTTNARHSYQTLPDRGDGIVLSAPSANNSINGPTSAGGRRKKNINTINQDTANANTDYYLGANTDASVLGDGNSLSGMMMTTTTSPKHQHLQQMHHLHHQAQQSSFSAPMRASPRSSPRSSPRRSPRHNNKGVSSNNDNIKSNNAVQGGGGGKSSNSGGFRRSPTGGRNSMRQKRYIDDDNDDSYMSEGAGTFDDDQNYTASNFAVNCVRGTYRNSDSSYDGNNHHHRGGGGVGRNGGRGGSGTGKESHHGDSRGVFSDPKLLQGAAALSAAAALGGIALGPLGIMIGAAALGLGVGVMQIPEEQRSGFQRRATLGFREAQDCVTSAGGHLSSNIITVCHKAGVDSSSVVPSTVAQIITCNGHGHNSPKSSVMGDCVDREEFLSGDGNGDHHDHQGISFDSRDDRMLHGGNGGGGMSIDNYHNDTRLPLMIPKGKNRNVACLRRARITPVNQIHSLDPSSQPKAWLDVMASGLTTRDEKNEAMEEILILVKDKNHAKMFLEEGILDSLMWIVHGFFQKYSYLLHSVDDDNIVMYATIANNDDDMNDFNATKTTVEATTATTAISNNSSPNRLIGGTNGTNDGAGDLQHLNDYRDVRLAANCCVAVGKAHCAVVHTEGDLLLMSSYSRGSVPVERQLAQMLYEVPHHRGVSTPSLDIYGNPNNNNINSTTHININSNANSMMESNEVFTLTEMSLHEAEEMALSIKTLVDGKFDRHFQQFP